MSTHSPKTLMVLLNTCLPRLAIEPASCPPKMRLEITSKLSKRLPVRIAFKPDRRDLDKLRPGMSVEPKVHLD
jgi:hypothetical protein